ncbi:MULTISPECIES: autoinducer-binding transcriptional regulator TraR [Rhizobium/Agrobacterium group]|uniref:Transcriptional activator protein TraR n=1 Tax=Agrobacterium genomosp. 2 str. CFBP 5494 TaxID=1183436 RepID=A0A9W5B7I4_9HYPH|nr:MULTISPECIES: transcriptional regulator TraR [Rhizobium/Agrobacterium group]RSC21374.1 transcriptional regulator TraR [Agrobacterium sp. FDAARGOS_525]CAD7054531.1 conjugal transfer protein TraR [Rhizobium sp. P007]CDN95457.1 Transcriptional activator protein TraR [Agrobacterium tumefaciens]CUX03220.1 Transcriptional activator protein TraR [Agrobacterium genomosp. 2 str. CFBP 5494]
MQHWLDKLTDLTAIESDQCTLEDALAGLAEQIGFGGYAYLNIQPGHVRAITNYHPEWQSVYFERNYSALDPVVKRAKSMKRTFTWASEQEGSRLSKPERSFYAHAADFGIRSGITIPIKTANGSMSMFTLASEKLTIDLDREIDAVAAATAVAQLHARIAFLQARPSAENAAYLDPKEAAYLKWIAVGKTMEEAADLEGVKYNSVRVKLAETKKRFDVHTTTHLTALVIRRNLI